MSLREAVEADRKGPGGTCPIGLLIRGGTPPRSEDSDPLEADDREWLANVTQPGTLSPPAAVLTRHLKAAGYKLGEDAIKRHRSRVCSCATRGTDVAS